jgi:teichuronic acid biosynthesis glycosyltransferase TuaG
MAELISIITPAYNSARFVEETIRSVQAQTYPHWEMLITDDCSKDATAAVVEKIAKEDPRVKLLKNPKNSGPAVARNTSVSAATGKYMAFLDSDDVWLPHKLERQLDFMKRGGHAFSFTEYRRMSEDGGTIGGVVRVPDRLAYSDLTKNTAITTSTVLLNREQVGPVTLTPGFGYDDYVLWLELTRRGTVAQGLHEDLVRYRVTQGSVSRQRVRAAKWVWRILRENQGKDPVRAAWCLSNYAWRADWKHKTIRT